MKRLRPAHIIVAALLFAATSIPTSSFALSEDLELSVIYYENGEEVGATVYNSCLGHVDYSWGQQSGTLMLKRYYDCDDGTTRCYWYSWTGSEWELIDGAGCGSPIGGPERPRRPLY